MEDYNIYVNASKNQDVEKMLDQPSKKRAAVKKDIFIKGRQETIQDVIAFISNIVIFARFWVKIEKNNDEDYTFVVQLVTEVADILSSAEFMGFYSKLLYL